MELWVLLSFSLDPVKIHCYIVYSCKMTSSELPMTEGGKLLTFNSSQKVACIETLSTWCEGEVCMLCVLCWPHLRPGGGVPFKAWPLKAGVLLFRLLAASTGLLIKDLELSSTDARAQDGPLLHAAAAGCVALQTKYSALTLPLIFSEKYRNILYFRGSSLSN